MCPQEREHHWRNAFTCPISTLLTVSTIAIQIYRSFVSVSWGMRVISLKCETELLRRNNKSLLRSPHPISSLKTPLRVYHSLKSVTHKNNYVWGWERNNLNKPRPPRYAWDSPWSILFIKVTIIALLFSIFIVYEHFFGFYSMSCTVTLLAICASSRMRYGSSIGGNG